MKKICFLGASIDTCNRGVSALSVAACDLMVNNIDCCEITLLIGSRMATCNRKIIGDTGLIDVKVVSYSKGLSRGINNSIFFAFVVLLVSRLIPRGKIHNTIINIFPALTVMEQSDLIVDIFAGDSFSDIYGIDKFINNLVTRFCVRLLKKPYILLPQTYGPYKSLFSKIVARKILRGARIIFTRTKNDDELKTVLHGNLKNVHYCPDVAFALSIDSEYKKRFLNRPVINKMKEKTIVGLNINGLLYNGGYNRNNMFNLKLDYRAFINILVKELLSYKEVEVLLVPHTYMTTFSNDVENDLSACIKVKESCPDSKINIIDEDLDQNKIKTVIGCCDLFIGSRLHSCIAALSQGVVTIGAGYSKKFYEVFSTVNAEDLVIDLRETEVDNALSAVKKLYINRKHYRDGIIAGVYQNKQKLISSFKMLNGEI